MSFLGESRRAKGGPGILPLQDHSFLANGVELDDRRCVVAVRITGRTSKERRPLYGEKTTGDVVGAFNWPADTRPVGAWSWVFPSVTPVESFTPRGSTPSPSGRRPVATTTPTRNNLASPDGYVDRAGVLRTASGEIDWQRYQFLAQRGLIEGLTPEKRIYLQQALAAVNGGAAAAARAAVFGKPKSPPSPITANNTATASPVASDGSNKTSTTRTASRFYEGVLPVQSGWVSDRRFQKMSRTAPASWPDFPRGYYSLSVMATDEDNQSEMHMPADPRLVAPHVGGVPTMGTPVADVDGGNNLDPTRHAPLHSLARVVKAPSGTRGALAGNSRNWLSRLIGPSGLEDVSGGLVADMPNGRLVFGAESQLMGGPFDVGLPGDPHDIGGDADGNRINSLHISTEALFRNRRVPAEDGPLRFETYKDGSELAFPVRVHLGFDYQRGDFAWWTTSPLYRPTPTITPRGVPEPDPTPTPTTPGPGQPGGPIGPGGGAEGDPQPKRRGRIIDDYRQSRPIGIASVNELDLPGISFRPQSVSKGHPDLRYDPFPRQEDVDYHDRTTPMVARLQAWGAQYGQAATAGPQFNQAHAWNYTNGPRTMDGPTANGGLLLTPAEARAEHVDDGYSPKGVSVSTVYLAAGPNARLAVGYPDRYSGGLRDGYSMRENAGGITFAVHDADAAVTDVLSLQSDGRMDFHDHGEIEVAGGATAQSAITTTPVKLTCFDANGESAGMTVDHTDDSITAAKDGTYLVAFSISFDSDANTSWEFHLRIDGTEQDEGGKVTLTTAGDQQSMSFTAIKQLTASEKLTVYVQSDNAGGAEITVDFAQLTAVRIR